MRAVILLFFEKQILQNCRCYRHCTISLKPIFFPSDTFSLSRSCCGSELWCVKFRSRPRDTTNCISTTSAFWGHRRLSVSLRFLFFPLEPKIPDFFFFSTAVLVKSWLMFFLKALKMWESHSHPSHSSSLFLFFFSLKLSIQFLAPN